MVSTSAKLTIGLAAILLVSGFIGMQYYNSNNTSQKNTPEKYNTTIDFETSGGINHTEEYISLKKPEMESIVNDSAISSIEYKMEFNWTGLKQKYNAEEVIVGFYVWPRETAENREAQPVWRTLPETRYNLDNAPNGVTTYTTTVDLNSEHPTSISGEYKWFARLYKSNLSSRGSEVSNLGSGNSSGVQGSAYALASEYEVEN